MKSKNKKKSEADIQIYAKAKMEKIQVHEISEIKVEQYSNLKHDNHHDSFRINAPDELEDGKTYKDATISTIRSISIKIK